MTGKVEEKKVEEMVEITKKEYDELLSDQAFLRALEGAGVDNWEGFEFAQEALEQ